MFEQSEQREQEKSQERHEPKREERAIVLDFLPHGYPFEPVKPGSVKGPIAQAIGKTKFALLELAPRKGIFLQPHEEVYIGEGKREKIYSVLGKITLEKLTTTARAELELVIEKLIMEQEQRIIDFFNKAQPLTARMHQLELLPGLGKRYMWAILEARGQAPFKDFADLRARVKLIPDPKKLVVRRILAELSGKEKHFIFVQ